MKSNSRKKPIVSPEVLGPITNAARAPREPSARMMGHATDELSTSARFDVTGCRFAHNDGGGDCFPRCAEQVAGNSAYSQSVLLTAQMDAQALNRYPELQRACELELQEALQMRNAGDFVPDRRVDRAREMVGEMEFRRNVSDLGELRIRVLTRGYWEDSFALERLQLILNVKAIVISRAADGRYEVVREDPRLALAFSTLIDFSSSGSNGRITN